MDLTNIITMFLITFFATVIFTWFVRKTLRDADLSDNPIVSEHRHKAGTPTMGGIAFLFAILLILSLYYKNTNLLIISFIMLTGGVMGLLDDLLGLRVKEYQKVVKNISDSVVPAAAQYVADYQQGAGYNTDLFALAKAYETMRGDEDTKPLVDALIAAGEARAAFDKETKRMQQALNASLGQTDITGTLAEDLTAGLQGVYDAIDAIDLSDIDIEMPEIDMSAFDRAEERLDQFVDEWAKEQEEIARLNEMLSNTIANSIAGGVEAFTDMLFNLEDADASQILSALMQPFAQTAGQLGTMLLAQGVAVEAFKKSLESLQGAPAIAAGLSLIAISAAMKSGIRALAGKQAGASTATAYTGSDSASGMSFENYDSTITVEVVGKLSGSDILLAGSSQQKKWNR